MHFLTFSKFFDDYMPWKIWTIICSLICGCCCCFVCLFCFVFLTRYYLPIAYNRFQCNAVPCFWKYHRLSQEPLDHTLHRLVCTHFDAFWMLSCKYHHIILKKRIGNVTYHQLLKSKSLHNLLPFTPQKEWLYSRSLWVNPWGHSQ